MKRLLTSIVSLSLFLSPALSAGGENNPNADPKPCRIMVDQIETFLKIDPRKGYSFSSIDAWPPDLEYDEEYLFQRTFAPGIGKAKLLKPATVIEGAKELFPEYLSRENMKIAPEFFERRYAKDSSDIFREYRSIVIFDLSKSSGYMVMAQRGGSLFCVHNYTFEIIQKDGYRELQESGPRVFEGELCRPADFAIIQISGKDYILMNDTTLTGDWEEGQTKKGGFIFDIRLYPIGFIRDYDSTDIDTDKLDKLTCKIEARFEVTDKYGGLLKEISATP